MGKLKPVINESSIKKLIQAYYAMPNNGCGGNLHIVLDDGNIEHHFIKWCKGQCEKDNDPFGEFLAEALLLFTEDQLQKMYDEGFWGMLIYK